ncbi:MAG: hypothetical protein AB7P69_20660 [Candidatus Binatia bacterium]
MARSTNDLGELYPHVIRQATRRQQQVPVQNFLVFVMSREDRFHKLRGAVLTRFAQVICGQENDLGPARNMQQGDEGVLAFPFPFVGQTHGGEVFFKGEMEKAVQTSPFFIKPLLQEDAAELTDIVAELRGAAVGLVLA